MNVIPGIISSVQEDELFARIAIENNGVHYTACILNSSYDTTYSKPGIPVNMVFKETDTIISLPAENVVCCRNRFHSSIVSIVYGAIKTRIAADYKGFPIISLVASESARLLNLRIGLPVICMVKSTSMMLSRRELDS